MTTRPRGLKQKGRDGVVEEGFMDMKSLVKMLKSVVSGKEKDHANNNKTKTTKNTETKENTKTKENNKTKENTETKKNTKTKEVSKILSQKVGSIGPFMVKGVGMGINKVVKGGPGATAAKTAISVGDRLASEVRGPADRLRNLVLRTGNALVPRITK
jgi:hypothetical protein